MKGNKIRWYVLPILLASASVGFGQWNGSTVGARRTPAASTQTSPSQPVGPGTINYIEGQVSLNGQELSQRSVGAAALNPGQVLDTGNGYAEVLLTPGAFLRVGPNSELRMLSAGLANTSTELVRGAGILEVDQMIKGTALAVTMNGATTHIEKNGLYNFDAAQQAVMVLDGKATIQGPAGTQTLTKNREVLLSSNHPLKKRDVNENAVKAEPLYVWSKARSEDEAQASFSAARNAEAYVAAGPGWYWDPAWGFYGFWPADAMLYSPFGWGFYSPAFFGFGFYPGLGYYPGVLYGHPVRLYGRVGGINARVGAFRSGAVAHPMVSGGFHGGFAGGGFHGGGRR
jgi:hypothetical protein